MVFNPKGKGYEGWIERRCAVWKCTANAIMPGKFCQPHRFQYMAQGAADTGPVDPKLRRLYIDAVMRRVFPERQRTSKRLSRAVPLKLSEHEKRSMRETLVDLQQRLQALPEPLNYYRVETECRRSAQRKAQQALSWIVTQQGLEKASKLILAHAVGTEICPKLNTSERYRVSQVAKAVIRLVESEVVKNWIGREVKKKFPGGRGWYYKQAVYKILEPSIWIWTKEIHDKVREELKADTHKRTLELHGATPRQVDKYLREKGLIKGTQGAQSTGTQEARVGTPVDPECSSCVEHGWRFACAIHNTDEERALRWSPLQGEGRTP